MAIATSKLPSRLTSCNSNLLNVRSLSSLTSSPLNLTAPLSDPPTSPEQTPPDALDLDNTEKLFSSVKTGALVTSLLNLYAMAVDPLVEFGTKVMQSPVVMESQISKAAVVGAVKATVYKHFCAGETTEEASETVRRIWKQVGLRSILDYAVEDAEDDHAARRNLDGFHRTVDMVSALPPTSASMCLKITAICPIHLLERISDQLRWNYKNPAFELPWRTHCFPILSDSSPLYLTSSMPEPLTDQELHDFELAQERLNDLCKQCAKSNLMLLIDAEYSSVQPAIDYFTYLVALKFNKEQPIVYSTVQAYLRGTKERLEMMMKSGENEGICTGIKLVRGAYITRETRLASSLGVSSPINGSILETHRCYNECAAFLLEKVRDGSGAVVLATHNTKSGKLAAAKAEKLGIRKGDDKLQFAQLMGMADGLSLGLKNAGFQVNKYLPFGPVDHVIPYLVRRAEENKGFLSSSTLDRHLIRKELTRRLKAAVL
ncbi:proline dehydrogenase 1, mitochondrial-like [Carex rostrata]